MCLKTKRIVRVNQNRKLDQKTKTRSWKTTNCSVENSDNLGGYLWLCRYKLPLLHITHVIWSNVNIKISVIAALKCLKNFFKCLQFHKNWNSVCLRRMSNMIESSRAANKLTLCWNCHVSFCFQEKNLKSEKKILIAVYRHIEIKIFQNAVIILMLHV